jgi:recombination protein RecA
MSSKSESRESRISRICSEINKSDWGGEDNNAVTWLGSRETVSIPRWSSGCPALDDALGGGWPKGRFIEFFGPPSGGKTTACYHAIAEHQKAFPDEDCGLVDSEFTFDEEYAQAIGVNTKYLIVHQPEHGKQALNVLGMFIKMGLGLCVVDSVAALTTKEELEGDVGNIQVGAQARMMSTALKRLTAEAGLRHTSVIWTNQIREKIGVKWGNPETTPAGHALKHYASIRCRFNHIGNIKEGDEIVSSKTRADVQKNKTSAPFRRAEFCITFGIGIDIVAAILDDAIAYKVVDKRGSWLSFEGEQLGQGRAIVLSMLRSDAAMTDRIRKALEDKKLLIETGGKTINVSEKETAGKEIKRPKRTPVMDEVDQDEIGSSDGAEVYVEDA